jgi:leucyl/phenylalanyl-tRNA--protein transferase
MAVNRPLLLIKSHQQRCVLDLQNLHISRKLKRYARSLTLRINYNFSDCLDRIAKHHSQTWLIPPLCEALSHLHQQAIAGIAFHSIEVYDGQQLVAGEVGYTTGAIYSSLAGFHTQNGAGSVQLAVLGLILIENEFAFWDLGMEVPYKLTLGAQIVDRKTFLHRWQTHRKEKTPPWSVHQLNSEQIIQKLRENRAV